MFYCLGRLLACPCLPHTLPQLTASACHWLQLVIRMQGLDMCLFVLLIVHWCCKQTLLAQLETGKVLPDGTWYVGETSQLVFALWRDDVTSVLLDGRMDFSTLGPILDMTGGPVTRTSNLTITATNMNTRAIQPMLDFSFKQNIFRLAPGVTLTTDTIMFWRYDATESLFGLAPSPGATLQINRASFRPNVIGPGVSYLGQAAAPALQGTNDTFFCTRFGVCDYAYTLPDFNTTFPTGVDSAPLEVEVKDSYASAVNATWVLCPDPATRDACVQGWIESGKHQALYVPDEKSATVGVYARTILEIIEFMRNDTIDVIWLTQDVTDMTGVDAIYFSLPVFRTRGIAIHAATPPGVYVKLRLPYANRLLVTPPNIVFTFRQIILYWLNALPGIPDYGYDESDTMFVLNDCLYVMAVCPGAGWDPAPRQQGETASMPTRRRNGLCVNRTITPPADVVSNARSGSLDRFPSQTFLECYPIVWSSFYYVKSYFKANRSRTDMTFQLSYYVCDKYASDGCSAAYLKDVLNPDPCLLQEMSAAQLGDVPIPVFPPPAAPALRSNGPVGDSLAERNLIGLVVGLAVAFGSVMGLIIAWQLWRARNSRVKWAPRDGHQGQFLPMYITSTILLTNIHTTHSFRVGMTDEELRRLFAADPHTCRVLLGARIGGGGTAVVHHGRVKGMHVAVKIFQCSLDRLTTYFDEWALHSSLFHPHIIKLLGYRRDSKQPGIMMELCSGSLDMLLYPDAEASDREAMYSIASSTCAVPPLPVYDTPDLSMEFILSMGIQVALALDYMHTKVTHMDLKPPNILLKVRPVINQCLKPRYADPRTCKPELIKNYEEQGDPRENYVSLFMNNRPHDSVLGGHTVLAKIGDFGLGQVASRVPYKTANRGLKRGAGTVAYQAPECLTSSLVSVVDNKCDIYSMGIILWEMVHRQRPWAGLDASLIITQVCRNRRRPAFRSPCPPELRAIIERCWSQRPQDRPTAQQLVIMLRRVYDKVRLDTKEAQKQARRAARKAARRAAASAANPHVDEDDEDEDEDEEEEEEQVGLGRRMLRSVTCGGRGQADEEAAPDAASTGANNRLAGCWPRRKQQEAEPDMQADDYETMAAPESPAAGTYGRDYFDHGIAEELERAEDQATGQGEATASSHTATTRVAVSAGGHVPTPLPPEVGGHVAVRIGPAA